MEHDGLKCCIKNSTIDSIVKQDAEGTDRNYQDQSSQYGAKKKN